MKALRNDLITIKGYLCKGFLCDIIGNKFLTTYIYSLPEPRCGYFQGIFTKTGLFIMHRIVFVEKNLEIFKHE